jgi:hypothetical protein
VCPQLVACLRRLFSSCVHSELSHGNESEIRAGRKTKLVQKADKFAGTGAACPKYEQAAPNQLLVAKGIQPMVVIGHTESLITRINLVIWGARSLVVIRQGTPLPCLYVLIKDREKSGPSVVSGLFFFRFRRVSIILTGTGLTTMTGSAHRGRVSCLAAKNAEPQFSGCKVLGRALTLAPMNISHIRINGWWWAR